MNFSRRLSKSGFQPSTKILPHLSVLAFHQFHHPGCSDRCPEGFEGFEFDWGEARHAEREYEHTFYLVKWCCAGSGTARHAGLGPPWGCGRWDFLGLAPDLAGLRVTGVATCSARGLVSRRGDSAWTSAVQFSRGAVPLRERAWRPCLWSTRL